MVINQVYLFIIFTLNGIVIGLLFDFFRILRKCFRTKDYITYIEDICFWIITGIIILYSMCMFCNGELRMFMVLGLIMGISIYIFIFSRHIIKIFEKLINCILKITLITFKPIIKMVKVVSKTVKEGLRKVTKFISKILHKITLFIKKQKNVKR